MNEDVCPVENGEMFQCHVSFQGCIGFYHVLHVCSSYAWQEMIEIQGQRMASCDEPEIKRRAMDGKTVFRANIAGISTVSHPDNRK